MTDRQLPDYPVYVISKGRPDHRCLTARFMIRDGCPFRLVIEPQEADAYAEHFDRDLFLVLPFSDLGQGSIPARNFVWEHSIETGADRHWIIDDNINDMYRRFKAQRLRVDAGIALRTCEDFTDRYENIAITGMQYTMFMPELLSAPPLYVNTHVYSCLLIRNDLPHRWRGRYNEDTDLCLQVLADGWCTVAINAFMIDKVASMKMTGGNTDDLYADDGRLKMARSLERDWPGVVETKSRYGRPQHVVKGNWSGFDTPLIRRTDLDWDKIADTKHPMRLVQVSDEVKSEMLRDMLDDQDRTEP